MDNKPQPLMKKMNSEDHQAAAYDAAQPDPRRPGRPPSDVTSATAHIHLRVTPERKSAYVRAAKPQSLAEWMTEACDRAAFYEPRK